MLRQNQLRPLAEVEAAWSQGMRFVVLIAPTGFGKTVCLAHMIQKEQGYTLAKAHRRELIGQLAMAMARNGVRHRIIGPPSLIQKVVKKQMRELGRSFYDPNARCIVASVDSINLTKPEVLALLAQVTLVVVDEAHHLLKENKWGKVVAALHPECRGLLPTATCFRADGKGLGRHADGYADTMVFADPLRTVIEQGYLVDYKLVLSKPADYERPSDDEMTGSGEFKPAAAAQSVHRSKQIVGDVVAEYLKHARGKRGLTFTVDVPSAVEVAQAYRDAGVPAEVVTGNTDPDWRDKIFERFEAGTVLQIVNVGIAGEGTDIPGVEVVSLAAPTMSKGWFDQMFGRVLRLNITRDQMAKWDTFTTEQRLALIGASPKPYGLVIDHCDNVRTHLPPDGPRKHTLDRRDRRARAKDDGVIPMRMCLGTLDAPGCFKPYEKSLPACPYCGIPVPLPVPGQRRTPEQVDGDLFLLDADAMEALRQGVLSAQAFVPNIPFGATAAMAQSAANKHRERGQSLNALRDVMALWCGAERAAGHDDRMIQRRFFHSFGIDVMSAQALNRAEADALRERVQAVCDACGITAIDSLVKEDRMTG
jgi:DNA repair protein RadD